MRGLVAASALCAGLAAAPSASAQDNAEIAAQLDALETRVERLEDANQVERVQRTYGYLVDKGQWTMVTDLFSRDATLEIGGRGVFVGKSGVGTYMQEGFGADGIREGSLINHMQFQAIVDVDPDGMTAKQRSRAFVISPGGWGLPMYENEYVKEDGVWKISKLFGPFTMYSGWDGWARSPTSNTWPADRPSVPPPDLPPSVVYLMYPSYYIVPYHYPNPVTGRRFEPAAAPAGAYPAPKE